MGQSLTLSISFQPDQSLDQETSSYDIGNGLGTRHSKCLKWDVDHLRKDIASKLKHTMFWKLWRKTECLERECLSKRKERYHEYFIKFPRCWDILYSLRCHNLEKISVSWFIVDEPNLWICFAARFAHWGVETHSKYSQNATKSQVKGTSSPCLSSIVYAKNIFGSDTGRERCDARSPSNFVR